MNPAPVFVLMSTRPRASKHISSMSTSPAPPAPPAPPVSTQVDLETRPLTDAEIEWLTDFVQPSRLIPREVAESLYQLQRTPMMQDLKEVRLHESMLGRLKEELRWLYQRALISAGDPVGIKAGTSTCASVMQTTMNTFQVAGAGNSAALLASIASQIFSALKVNRFPTMQIYPMQTFHTIQEIRQAFGSSLVCKKVHDLMCKPAISSHFIHAQDYAFGDESWHKLYGILHPAQVQEILGQGHETSRCMTIKINELEMVEHMITLEMICSAIELGYPTIVCVPVPFDASRGYAAIQLYVDYTKLQLPESAVPEPEEDMSVYVIEDVVLPKLYTLKVCGIDGIENRHFVQDRDACGGTGGWYIETLGINLPEVMGHPLVNSLRTGCNYLWDIYQYLGIEAARNFMIGMITKVSSGVSRCHYTTIIDQMTSRGTPCPISRHTIGGDGRGPLSAAAHERTVAVLAEAASKGSIDRIVGPSPCILAGVGPKLGTGSKFTLLPDLSKLFGPEMLAPPVAGAAGAAIKSRVEPGKKIKTWVTAEKAVTQKIVGSKTSVVIREMLSDRGYVKIEPVTNPENPDQEIRVASGPVSADGRCRRLGLFGDSAEASVGIEKLIRYKEILANSKELFGMEIFKAILICKSLSAPVRDALARMAETRDPIQIEVFYLSELQFNPTRHVLCPKHSLVPTDMAVAIIKEYGRDLPVLLASDPVSRFMGFRRGSLVRVEREGYSHNGVKIPDISYRLVM